jgi:glycosyltransferase involved in cell wall biosynthesis
MREKAAAARNGGVVSATEGMSVKLPEAPPRLLRFAVHGILADGAGSGAGTFPVLLAKLLERGHEVHFFGRSGFTEPKSLERFRGYRFVALRIDRLDRLWERVVRWKSPYPVSALAQVAALAVQREATRAIEAERERFDLVLCTDAQAAFRSSLPVVSWPQSPPQSEASALRAPGVRERVLEVSGRRSYAAVQAFYAYRRLLAAAARKRSDLYICGSRWALEEWQRFGVERERLQTSAYLIDLEPFSSVPALEGGERPRTVAWLGRATPRKRLDLFLEAVRVLRRRGVPVRARLVGNLQRDPFSARVLAPYLGDPGLVVEEPVPRARVPALLSEIDVLVQPSEQENFGFSLAEALAAGRPVVAGPTNGTLDYAGAAGFAFGAYDAESVALATERALRAVARQGEALSAEARAAAQQHFEPERVVERFLAASTRLVEARSRGA